MLVNELRERVFVFPIPDGAKSFDYEIQDSTLGAGYATIVGYFMDGNGGQVMIPKRGGKWDPHLALLTSKERMLTRATQQRFDDAGVEGWRVTGPAILRWFIDGWKAAGGKTRFPLPASICFHDGDATPLPHAKPARAEPIETEASPQYRGPRRLVCTQEGSSKFWEGSVRDLRLVVSWGKIETKGQTRITAFSTRRGAIRELESLILQKLRKGYVEG
jgi:predicted DNA-binding WGR domain protein